MDETQFVNVTALTSYWVGDEEMASKQGTLPEMRVGDSRELAIKTRWSSGANKGQDRDIYQGTYLVYDPDRTLSSTADSGSTTTIVDATLTDVDDFWNGMPITITVSGEDYQTEITDYDLNTTTLTFNAIPVAVTTDAYVIGGYPTRPRTLATVDGATGSITLNVNNCTGTPGTRYVVYRAMCGTEDTPTGIEEFVGKLTVRAAAFVG